MNRNPQTCRPKRSTPVLRLVGGAPTSGPAPSASRGAESTLVSDPTFGPRLEAMLARSGRPLFDVAQLVGVPPCVLTRWCEPRSRPWRIEARTLDVLARILGTSAEFLLRGIGATPGSLLDIVEFNMIYLDDDPNAGLAGLGGRLIAIRELFTEERTASGSAVGAIKRRIIEHLRLCLLMADELKPVLERLLTQAETATD